MEGTLEIGDIVQFIRYDNVDGQPVLIKYIDESVIEFVKENTESSISIINGVLQDETIQEINVLSRASEKGYAKQNGLTVDTWIDVYFSGELPLILTGQIKEQENDMIRIDVINPVNETIYIDFAYKGLPKYLNVSSIKKRETPPDYILPNRDDTDAESETEADEEFDDDEFAFDGEQDIIKQIVEAEEDHRRFHIQTQKEDLLNDILSKIPTSQRTNDVLHDVHKTLERFEQLRTLYSAYDENKYISGIKHQNESHHPLADQIISGTHIPLWIIPVVENKMDVYVTDDEKNVIVNNDDIRIQEIETFIHNIPENENVTYSTLFPYTMYDSDTSFHIQKLNNEVYIDNFSDSVLKKTVLQRSDDGYMYSIQNHYKTSYIYNESASLRGLITLPEQYMMYEQQYNPGMNIMNKINIPLLPFSYDMKELLHDVFIDPQYAIYHAIPNEVKENTDETSSDRFRAYMNNLLPSPLSLLSYILPYTELSKQLSYENIVSLLYQIRVLPEHITYPKYKKIISIVNDAQRIYEKSLLGGNNRLKRSKVKSRMNRFINALIGKEEEEVLQSYKIGRPFISEEEAFSHVVEHDFGEGYIASLARQNMDLIQTSNITKDIVDRKIQTIQAKKKERNEKNALCKPLYLTKTYLSFDDLERDNQKEVLFVDANYDETRYDIVDEFKEKEDIMSTEDFNVFLINHLKQFVGLKEDDARKEAQSLIERKRRVYDGDYAVLKKNEEPTLYYKRQKQVWILDETKSEESEGINFCNSRRECISTKDSCYHIDNMKEAVEERETKILMEDILSEEQVTLQSIKDDIQRTYLLYKERILDRYDIHDAKSLKYNNMFTMLSVSEVDILQTSPYEEIKSRLFAMPFQRKMKMMEQFIDKATRRGIEIDDPWLYCVKTGAPLLPSYYTDLVRAFKRETYADELDHICMKRGVLSDDGDKWVDKFTGYIIKNIEFQSDYQGDAENDLRIDYKSVSEQKFTTPELMFLENVISFLSSSMGISMSHEYKYIVKYAHETTMRMTSFEKFQERVRAKYKTLTDKKIKKKFEEQKYTNLLLNAGLYFLIYVQTAIPSISMKKAFPGCKKSLSGYPTILSGDEKGIQYVACIMKNASISTRDGTFWSVIKKMPTDKIVKLMKGIYEKFASKNSVIHNKIIKKTNYTEKPVIRDENNLWTSFVPFLYNRRDKKSYTALGKTFISNLSKEVKQARPEQHKSLHMLHCHMGHMMERFLDLMNHYIQKEELLLGSNHNEPYLENACCNSSNESFIKKYQHLQNNIDIIRKEERIYDIYIQLKHAPYLSLNDTDSKEDNDEDTIFFSKEIINQMYYVLCKKNIIKNKLCDDYNEDIESFSKYLRRIHKEINKEDVLSIFTEHSTLDTGDDIIVRDTFSWKDRINTIDNQDTVQILFQKDALNKILQENQEYTIEIQEFIETYIRRNETFKIREIRNFLEQGMYFEHYDPDKIDTDTAVKYATFFKYAISLFATMFISRENQNHYIPSHWDLSGFHSSDVLRILRNSEKLDIRHDVFTEDIIEQMNNIRIISETLPYYWKENPRTLIEYYKYLLLRILIHTVNSKSITEDPNDEILEADAQRDILEHIADHFLVRFIELKSHFNIINVDANENKQRIIRMRDDEKNRKLREFQKMNKEERVVDNLLKSVKLGKYGIGFQKGFREYDPDFYDQERGDLLKEINEDDTALSELSRRNIELFDFNASELRLQEDEDNEVIMGEDDEDIYEN